MQDILKKDENIKKYKELEESYFEKLNTSLDEYIDKNPESLFNLGETNVKGTNKDFQDVISFQETEITSLNEIVEEIKERNTLSNNNFKNSLQSMLNDDLLKKSPPEYNVNLQEDKTIKKEEFNL